MRYAIVGASGAVGQELLGLLRERRGALRVDTLELYGSERSAGRRYPFAGGEELEVRLLRHDPEDFRGVDVVFTSAGASVSRDYAEDITALGATMIDNSSAFRMDPEVPLVVPEVNAADALEAPRRIIGNPNCTTIQMVVALNPLAKLSELRRVHVATYQAASGAGAAAMDELRQQHSQIAAGEAPTVRRFAHQLAFNVIPHIDVFTDNGYTKEEMKMVNETRKIMHSPGLAVSATCVRVPVLRAHSEAVWAELSAPVTVQEAAEAFRAAPGVVLMDDPAAGVYPMPLDLAGCDPVYVGRLRQDLCDPCSLAFWTVSDQIRKGAALNAVQIAQYLLDHKG